MKLKMLIFVLNKGKNSINSKMNENFNTDNNIVLKSETLFLIYISQNYVSSPYLRRLIQCLKLRSISLVMFTVLYSQQIFHQEKKDLPMGLLKANHLIEQDCVHYDGSVKIDNGDFLQGSPLCNYLVSKLKSSLPININI